MNEQSNELTDDQDPKTCQFSEVVTMPDVNSCVIFKMPHMTTIEKLTDIKLEHKPIMSLTIKDSAIVGSRLTINSFVIRTPNFTIVSMIKKDALEKFKKSLLMAISIEWDGFTKLKTQLSNGQVLEIEIKQFIENTVFLIETMNYKYAFHDCNFDNELPIVIATLGRKGIVVSYNDIHINFICMDIMEAMIKQNKGVICSKEFEKGIIYHNSYFLGEKTTLVNE